MAWSNSQAGPENAEPQLFGAAPGPRRSGAVSGRLARRPPPVPVPLGVVLRGARLHEPGMLVRGVVDHQVHDQLHAPGVQPVRQLPQLLERAEDRVHVAVVADVVAVVVLRGRVDRGQPDDVDAEPVQVVELADDAAQVPDAVPVRVGEAARIDLVDDGAPEPIAGRNLNGFFSRLFYRHGDSSAGPAASTGADSPTSDY